MLSPLTAADGEGSSSPSRDEPSTTAVDPTPSNTESAVAASDEGPRHDVRAHVHEKEQETSLIITALRMRGWFDTLRFGVRAAWLLLLPSKQNGDAARAPQGDDQGKKAD